MFRIKSKDNNPARFYFYYSTGAGGYIPKHLLPIFEQERENIDFWLKNVNIVKLIEENKLLKTEDDENGYALRFTYYLIPYVSELFQK